MGISLGVCCLSWTYSASQICRYLSVAIVRKFSLLQHTPSFCSPETVMNEWPLLHGSLRFCSLSYQSVVSLLFRLGTSYFILQVTSLFPSVPCILLLSPTIELLILVIVFFSVQKFLFSSSLHLVCLC